MPKETKDETRRQIKEDLEASATKYADYAENTISRLQRAYLKKNSHNTEVLQLPEDPQNKRFGGKISALFRGRREDLREPEIAKPSKSEEGIVDITHGFQVSLLSRPSELASDNACLFAISKLNDLRSMRVENLGDGYDVSGFICYDIGSRYVAHSASRRIRFHANFQGHSCDIYRRNDVSRTQSSCPFLGSSRLTQHAAQHAQSMTT